MSEMTTNASSDDTLIRDSQLSGFSSFKEHLAFCCCRIFKKSSTYDLSSVSKNNEEQQQDKPSYINQGFQGEKQARKDKLDKIAKTLPNAKSNGTQGKRTPTSVIQTPTRSLTTITQPTPRSGITVTQIRPPISTPVTKTGISTINKPSSLATNKKKQDETSTDESSEEESSSDDDDRSSASDKAPAKRAPVKNTSKRR